MSAVNTAMAQLERSSISLRPCWSARRPHSGDAKAATNEVEPFRMPAHRSIAASVCTPSTGRNSGMIGLRKLNDMVMMNWMPTIAHSVTCQLEALEVASCVLSVAGVLRAASVIRATVTRGRSIVEHRRVASRNDRR